MGSGIWATRAPEEEVTDYIDNFREILLETHGLVRYKIIITNDCTKARYEARANQRQFSEGDLVWLHNPVRKKVRSPHLSPTVKDLIE